MPSSRKLPPAPTQQLRYGHSHIGSPFFSSKDSAAMQGTAREAKREQSLFSSEDRSHLDSSVNLTTSQMEEIEDGDDYSDYGEKDETNGGNENFNSDSDLISYCNSESNSYQSFVGHPDDFFLSNDLPVLEDAHAKREEKETSEYTLTSSDESLRSPQWQKNISNISNITSTSADYQRPLSRTSARLSSTADDSMDDDSSLEASIPLDMSMASDIRQTQTHVTLPVALRPSVIPVQSSCSMGTAHSALFYDRNSVKNSIYHKSNSKAIDPTMYNTDTNTNTFSSVMLHYNKVRKLSNESTTNLNSNATEVRRKSGNSSLLFSNISQNPCCPDDRSTTSLRQTQTCKGQTQSKPWEKLYASESCPINLLERSTSSVKESPIQHLTPSIINSNIIDSTVLHSGYLYNFECQSVLRCGWWKLRHFVLTYNSLKYYKKEHGKLKGKIDLDSCTTQSIQFSSSFTSAKFVTVPVFHSSKTLWKFSIQTKKKKRHYLSTYSEADLNLWMAKLSLAFRIANANINQRFTEPRKEHINR